MYPGAENIPHAGRKSTARTALRRHAFTQPDPWNTTLHAGTPSLPAADGIRDKIDDGDHHRRRDTHILPEYAHDYANRTISWYATSAPM